MLHSSCMVATDRYYNIAVLENLSFKRLLGSQPVERPLVCTTLVYKHTHIVHCPFLQNPDTAYQRATLHHVPLVVITCLSFQRHHFASYQTFSSLGQSNHALGQLIYCFLMWFSDCLRPWHVTASFYNSSIVFLGATKRVQKPFYCEKFQRVPRQAGSGCCNNCFDISRSASFTCSMQLQNRMVVSGISLSWSLQESEVYHAVLRIQF